MDAYNPLESAYTTDQVIAWLQLLRLPNSYTQYISTPSTFPKTYEALRTLMRSQISRFAFDNLTVHYSPTHMVDIDPQALYTKLTRSGPNGPNRRGGFCMEVNIFFHHMLCGLGFRAYMTGVRNRPRTNGVPQGDFGGFTHMTNIVQLPSGDKFCVDVAFGGDGSTNPLPMDGRGQAIQNIGTQQVRLIHDTIPKQQFRAGKLWIYQYRNRPSDEWNPFYCFAEVEWFQADYEILNLWACYKPPHTVSVWAVRFLREGQGVEFSEDTEAELPLDRDVEIIGKVMLVDNVVKANLGGKTQVIHEFETEAERIQALKDYFGMYFTEEEARSIRGRSTELGG